MFGQDAPDLVEYLLSIAFLIILIVVCINIFVNYIVPYLAAM